MYAKILVATDGSELASKAVETGAGLAKRLGAELIVALVTEALPPLDAAAQAEVGDTNPFGHYDEMTTRNARRSLAAAEKIAKEIGVTCETIHVKDTYPATGIVDTATARGADLIVIASHGRRGLRRLLLGSVTNEVLVESKVPVLVCR